MNLSHNISTGIASKAARVARTYGKLPPGLYREGGNGKDGRLVHHPEDAPLMRSYFFSFLRERLSYWQLADKATAELSAEGRSKLKNGKVTGDRMRRWLSNPCTSVTSHLGEEYPGQHEAVIDRETFDAVQRRIANAPPRPKCDDDAEIIYARPAATSARTGSRRSCEAGRSRRRQAPRGHHGDR